MGTPEFDAEIKDKFGSLVDQARASKLNAWTEQPKGTLALLVLLDQFPRNIFRGSSLSYSSDETASTIATQAIANGFDVAVSPMQQAFFYLPLMHSESLLGQVASKVLLEGMVRRCDPESEAGMFAKVSLSIAQKHMDVIKQFGHFPARNEALGRESTVEEIEFLKEHPGGF